VHLERSCIKRGCI